MQSKTETKYRKVLLPLSFLISLLVLLYTAWLGDDAFITIRTVDNWVNGFGLTWNINERVQAYTHPLWMLLLSAFHFFIRDGYFTLLIANIVVSLIVFAVFLHHFSAKIFPLFFGWGILILSKAFVDYSTSGLENALSHLLLLLFIIIFLDETHPLDARRFFLLALIASLGTVNRMDSLLFFLPALLYIWLTQYRGLRGLWILVAGFVPFLLWELFSLLYYGFPFPNTAYAKLNSGIPTFDLMRQGGIYFLNSLKWDPLTLTVTALAITTTFLHNADREKTVAGGIILYLAYIVYIGGDFMSGRFFSAVLLVSAFLLTKFVAELNRNWKLIFSMLVVVMGAFGIIFPNRYADNTSLDGMIANERGIYFQSTNPFVLNGGDVNHPWADIGRTYKSDGITFSAEGSIGFVGYYAGPEVYIVDVNALTDPLLARLNMMDTENWRIGHFTRDYPAGYIDTIKLGKNRIIDPSLAEYYNKMKIIISGQLLSTERLITIWEMNTGKYDHLLKEYAERQ